MSKLLVIFTVLNFLTLGILAFQPKHPEMKAFPAPGDGMARFYVVLEEKAPKEEEGLTVEIIAGKTMVTDGVTPVRLGSVIVPRSLEGREEVCYEVTGGSEIPGPNMGYPEGTLGVKRFVKAAPLKVRYDSRFPVVVYAPEGYEVRYRIWKGDALVEAAGKGAQRETAPPAVKG